MHLKRNKMPKTWPIERKGTKYITRSFSRNSIPLIIALRDMLKVVKIRKEAKHLLNLKKVKVNGKLINEEKYPIGLFDNLTLDNKNYKLVFKNKKFNFEEISHEQTSRKIAKVIGKKILPGKKLQVNLSDGRNYMITGKVNTGDSALIDFNSNKISEILALKQNSKIIFISGKHIGEHGEIEKIEKKNAVVKSGNKKINADLESLMAVK